jgi:outer membrane protein TolC
MLKTRDVLAVVLTLAAPAAGAAEPLRVSLAEAIFRTLREGTTAQLAEEQLVSARFTADRAHSPLLPQLQAEAQGVNQSLNLQVLGLKAPEPVIPPFNVFEGRLSARLALLDVAAIQRYRAAKSLVAVSAAERQRLRSEAAAATARLYVGLLKAQALLQQSDATVRLFDKVLGLARRQREAGVAARLDALRAEVQLNQQRRALLLARQRREEAQRALLEAMGADIGAEVTPTEDLGPEAVAPAAGPALTELLRIARARRPELLSLREQRRAAELGVRAAQAERLPSLHAEVFADESGNTLSDLHYTRGGAVGVTFPLFTGGRIGAEVGEARSRQHAAEIRERAIERLVERQVRDALRALEITRERLATAAATAKLTAEELESAQNRFGVGVTASVEVDNAQTAYVNAREELIAAQADLAQARVDLDFATGQLAPEKP